MTEQELQWHAQWVALRANEWPLRDGLSQAAAIKERDLLLEGERLWETLSDFGKPVQHL